MFAPELQTLPVTAALLTAITSAGSGEDREFIVDEWVVGHPVSSTTGCITCIIADHLLTVLNSDLVSIVVRSQLIDVCSAGSLHTSLSLQ